MYGVHGIGWGMHYGMGWGLGLGWFFGLVVLGLVIWLIVRLAATHGTPIDSYRQKTALEVLKDRYARGEIDKEEYEERKRVLLQ